MPVDKFGRMREAKTEDSGVSLTYINNNYVRSDGHTPLTGSLDMRGNTIYNVADPVNPQDVVTKIYVDNTKGSGVIGRKTKDGVSIKENMDFLNKQRIKNLPAPVDAKDAVSREYVENVAINHPFQYVNNAYEAKADLDLKGNKIKNLCSPFEDGDAATKGYLDTQSATFLKVDQGEYMAKADINLNNIYTVYNAKDPIDGAHVTNKKYVDDQINFNSAFSKKNGGYEAKGHIYLRRNKILGLPEPMQPGEPTTKKYVDGVVNNMLKQYIDDDDNIILNKNVDMEGNKVFNIPDPVDDSEAVNKKYVDDLQTQHVDQKGNIKFGRNVNLDNKRIFAMKEPRKDNEGANKKYVDNAITQRIEEEKNNFLPQDSATKHYVDEAIKGLAGGDVLVSKEGVFIKENGHYRATAPLDIDNQKMENVPDPVDDHDAVNKKYVDEVVKDLTQEEALLRENGGYNIADAYINMNFNRIRNVGPPKHNEDAAPKSYIDGEILAVEEKIKKRTHLITAHASYHGDLIKGKYQFTFSKPNNLTYDKHDVFNGFMVPANGIIRNFTFLDTGIKFNLPENKDFLNYILYDIGYNSPIPFFTVVLIRHLKEPLDIGTYYFYFTELFKNDQSKLSYTFKFNPNFKKKELLTVETRDIINIRSEFNSVRLSEYRFLVNNKNYSISSYEGKEFFIYHFSLLIELDPFIFIDEEDDN